ncbi:pilin [Candidatus Parcubacteria bacterium]|nr:pilin [Candidatus Parcubacteria bacterium]
MSRALFITIIVCLIVTAVPLQITSAEECPANTYCFLAPLTDVDSVPNTREGFTQYLSTAIRIIVGLAGVLAVLALVVGGFMYVSAESLGKKTQARSIIQRTLWGLFLILASTLILQTINPELLSLGRLYTSIENLGTQVGTTRDPVPVIGSGERIDPGSIIVIPGRPRGGNPRTGPGISTSTGGTGGTGSGSGGTGGTGGSGGGGGTTFPRPRPIPPPAIPPGPPAIPGIPTGPIYPGGGTGGSGGGSGGGGPSDGGFTDTRPTGQTRVVYVSSAGQNSNRGTEASPVKTVQKALELAGNNTNSIIYLKAGEQFDNFSIQKSGASPSSRLMITSYGSGARPKIVSGAQENGIGIAAGEKYIALIGLHVQGNNSRGSGINMEARPGIRYVLMEDMYIEGYVHGIDVTSGHGARITDITIRRSVITNSMPVSGLDKHAIGMYAEGVDNLVIEENVWDNNGRRPDGSGASQFNQNVYINGLSGPVFARGNIFSNSGSHGIQARSGGVVENNFFYKNPVHMSFGLVNGDGPIHSGGVSGRVSGNVGIFSNLITAGPNQGVRSMGIQLGNIIGNTTVSNNIFAYDNYNTRSPVFSLEACKGVYASDGVGIHNLTIENNIVYDWTTPFDISGDMKAGTSGYKSMSGVVLRNNTFSNNQSGMTTTQGTISVQPQNINKNFDQFIQNAKQNSRASWNTQYTAAAAIEYVRSGFGR